MDSRGAAEGDEGSKGWPVSRHGSVEAHIFENLATKFAVFVLDLTDEVPLAGPERRHFTGYDGRNLWKHQRSARGSRNGPLSWAGPSSLLFRCTQAVF